MLACKTPTGASCKGKEKGKGKGKSSNRHHAKNSSTSNSATAADVSNNDSLTTGNNGSNQAASSGDSSRKPAPGGDSSSSRKPAPGGTSSSSTLLRSRQQHRSQHSLLSSSDQHQFHQFHYREEIQLTRSQEQLSAAGCQLLRPSQLIFQQQQQQRFGSTERFWDDNSKPGFRPFVPRSEQQQQQPQPLLATESSFISPRQPELLNTNRRFISVVETRIEAVGNGEEPLER